MQQIKLNEQPRPQSNENTETITSYATNALLKKQSSSLTTRPTV